MKLCVQIAWSRAEVASCRDLIADVYRTEYGVTFSEDGHDLDAKIEPWPHRFAMGLVDGELVATMGLYVRDTYVERFGACGDAEIQALIDAAGAGERFLAAHKRELAKMTVRREWRRRGINHFFAPATLSHDFVQLDGDHPSVIVCCGKRSIWENIWHRAGCTTRIIKPFPAYKAHELYRSDGDPMDSRLMIPGIDIPVRWSNLTLPCELEVEQQKTA